MRAYKEALKINRILLSIYPTKNTQDWINNYKFINGVYEKIEIRSDKKEFIEDIVFNPNYCTACKHEKIPENTLWPERSKCINCKFFKKNGDCTDGFTKLLGKF